MATSHRVEYGGGVAAAGGAAGGLAGLLFAPFMGLLIPAIGGGLAATYWYKRFAGDPPPAVVRVNGAPMPTAATSSVILPDRALLIPAAGLLGQFQDYDSPSFQRVQYLPGILSTTNQRSCPGAKSIGF